VGVRWREERSMTTDDDRRVTLEESRSGGTSLHLSARLRDGAVIIRGDDRGSAVEEFFGGSQRGYEWAITVDEDDVPDLLRLLGEDENADPLDALQGWVDSGGSTHFKSMFDEHDVEYSFWSWIGD
jgi:hypothetical protein